MEDIQYNKPIIILGAGGLGRDFLSWMALEKKPFIKGFLDDNLNALNNFKDISYPVLGKLNDREKHPDTHQILAINNSLLKEKLFSLQTIGYIHSSVKIGTSSKYDPSVSLFPSVLISCNVTIEKGVFISAGCIIGHDTTIDAFSSIMPGVNISGNCTIGKHVFIGTGASILPGVTIPDNTVIGAGCIVVRSIKKAGTYIGNPAKRLL